METLHARNFFPSIVAPTSRPNRQAIRLLLCSAALCFVTAKESFSADAWPGIRYPSPQDLRGAWSEPGAPYHVRADFDGNGLIDDAWILIEGAYEWRLEVFLAQPSGKPKSDLLEEIRVPSLPPQRVVLSVVEPPVRFITSHDVPIKDCVPDEQDDMDPGCTTVEWKETIVNLPGLRFCIVNGGCATYVWNAQDGALEPITILLLPMVNAVPDAFVGRHHSSKTPEVLGVPAFGSGGLWTAANHMEYSISTAGFPSEQGMLIRYLWLNKWLTKEAFNLEQLEIRFAVSVEPYPPSAGYDIGSCQMQEKDKTIVAIIDYLPNGAMRPLQAWSLDVDNEKLIPLAVKDLDCRDRKW